MYREIATHVYRRATEDNVAYQLPGWAVGLLLLDLVIFLPAYLVIGYSLTNIFPVLAMIEDPSPPAYEPVSLNADADSLADDTAPLADEAARGGQDTRAITSSFRGIHRTLYAIAGWRSYFRGLAAWIVLSFAAMALFGAVSAIPFMPTIVAAMISALVLAQLYTAWLHIVISVPSARRFHQRLPPFGKAFRACALPTVMYFVALEIHAKAPRLLARVLGMTTWDFQNPGEVPQPAAGDSWKFLIVLLVSILLSIFLTIPAHVVLTRVQASLLPEEDETIVPFDRSFQNKLEPAIIGGRGYISVKDAWTTFSRASWIRLVKLYLKIFLASVAVWAALMVILVPEMILIFANSKKTA